MSLLLSPELLEAIQRAIVKCLSDESIINKPIESMADNLTNVVIENLTVSFENINKRHDELNEEVVNVNLNYVWENSRKFVFCFCFFWISLTV